MSLIANAFTWEDVRLLERVADVHQLPDLGALAAKVRGAIEQQKFRGQRLPLTKRQAEFYLFLLEFSGEHGYAPTYEEIAARFDYASLATVYEHMGTLERKGYVKRTYNSTRGTTCLIHPDELSPEPKPKVTGP